MKKQKNARKTKNPGSSPAETTPKTALPPEYFDSMANAAARLRIPLAQLKKYKKAGAPGFRGSRVYPGELVPWIEAQAEFAQQNPSPKELLELRKLTRVVEDLEFESNQKRGMYVARAAVVASWRLVAEQQKTMLLSKCRNELAPKLAGKSVIETIELLEAFALDICAIHERGLAQWFLPEQLADGAGI